MTARKTPTDYTNKLAIIDEALQAFLWQATGEISDVSGKCRDAAEAYLLKNEFLAAALTIRVRIKTVPAGTTRDKTGAAIREVLAFAKKFHRKNGFNDEAAAKQMLFALHEAGERAVPNQKTDKDLTAAWNAYTEELCRSGKQTIVQDVICGIRTTHPSSSLQQRIKNQISELGRS